MKVCSLLKRIGYIFSLALALSSGLMAEAKVWTLSELEARAAENNLDIHSIQSEQNVKKVERALIDSRFKPILYGKAGFISERTADEDRVGPVATIEGRWNIYRGGRDELAKKLAESELQSLNFELASRKQAIVFEVRSLFYNLLAEKEKKSLLREEIQINDRQRKIATRRATSGVATNADELEFRLRGQELQSMEKTLQAEEQKNLNFLKNLANLPLEEMLSISGSFQAAASSILPVDINLNPAVLRLQTKLNILAQEKDRINAAYKPEIDAFANVGKISPTETAKKLESVIGLTVSVPLYDGLQQRSALQIAQFSQQKAQLEIQKLQLDTASVIQGIEIERKELGQLREINEQRLSYAQKYLTVTVQEYDRGVKNSPDVVGALEHLLGSKMRRIDLALQFAVLGAKQQSLIGGTNIKVESAEEVK